MSKKLDQTGRAAQVHLHELQLCVDKTKTYAARRREATERLRPMLTEIWAALEKDTVVNGCRGKEEWARWFNPSAKGANGIRQIQRIINPKKATSRRPSPVKLLKRLITFISEQPRNQKDPDSLREIRGEAMEIGDQINFNPPVWKKEMDDERAADRLEEKIMAEHEAKKNQPRLNQHTRFHKSVNDQILCGKYTGFTQSAQEDEQVNCPACLKLMEAPAQTLTKKMRQQARKHGWDKKPATKIEHTGQHEDCVECFEQERILQATRSAANDKWKKRVDSLIRQWRQYRLRNPKKYRAEFEKAAAAYLKKVGDYGKNSVIDGRGRMEAAIATQGVNTRIVTVIHINKPGTANGRQWDDSFCGLKGGDIHTDSHTSDRVNCPDCKAKSEKYYADFEARRTLTVVMKEEPPQGTPQHVIDRVAEIKRRAALGLPQGGTCPNEEEAV